MAEKLLSISIASYNIEPYIDNTLQSLIIDEEMQDVEVLIVNDGSKDNTLAKAREYEAKYPNIFKVIDKENGGYGTTVNRSVQEATGKYFKLLDGDDWVDQEGFRTLLEILRNNDVDLVLSRYWNVKEESFEKSISNPPWTQYEEKGVMNAADVKVEMRLGIWMSTVRTDILKKHMMQLPAHTLYTDQLFVTSFLPYVEKVYFSKVPVYCYRVGRDGQSVTKENRIKHVEEMLRVMDMIFQYYEECKDLPQANPDFLLSRVRLFYYVGVKWLLLCPISIENYKKLLSYENRAKEKYPDLYNIVYKYSKKVRIIRNTKFLGYFALSLIQENWA